MNIAHIKLFIRIAAHSNISAAGAELGLSPAVASAQLNKLEETLGARLVHRTTRKVSLTEEGKVFLVHAEDVINCIEAAQASVGIARTSLNGTLRVSAPASFGRMHLIPVISDFMALHPELNLDLKLSDSIVDLVEGGFDVAIRNSELKDSSIVAKKLTNDRRLLCASPSYIAKHGLPSSPKELSEHNCLTLMNMDHWTFEAGNQQQTIKVTGNFRTDNGEAIRDACNAGLGITINSAWSAYRELMNGELIEVLPQFPLVSDAAIWAIYPSARQLAPKVRTFIDYLGERFEGKPYWDQYLENQNKG